MIFCCNFAVSVNDTQSLLSFKADAERSEADAEEPVLSEVEGIYAFFRFFYAVLVYEYFQPGFRTKKFSCDCPLGCKGNLRKVTFYRSNPENFP